MTFKEAMKTDLAKGIYILLFGSGGVLITDTAKDAVDDRSLESRLDKIESNIIGIRNDVDKDREDIEYIYSYEIAPIKNKIDLMDRVDDDLKDKIRNIQVSLAYKVDRDGQNHWNNR